MLGNVGFVNLRPLGLALREAAGIETFLETGTYHAQTAAWASEHFERVITIEAHRPYYEQASKAHAGNRRIRFIFGDSRAELPRALGGINSPALVWLDAHWCGGYELSTGTPGECPLVEELEAIRGRGVRHLILIDDARLFVEPPPRPHDPRQWPNLGQIRSLLPEGYFTTIWSDAIICVPREYAPIVRRFTEPPGIHVAALASNDYLGCLRPFAYLFNKFWSSGQPVTVVRYEIRPRGLPGNFSNFAIGRQSEYSWSAGLAKYLRYLTCGRLILLLEDYFLVEPVQVGRLRSLWELMESEPEICKIDLSGDLVSRSTHGKYNHELVKAKASDPFRGSLQAAIWRRDYLLAEAERLPEADPWAFEKHSCKSGLVLGVREPAIRYINAVGGQGRKPGQYDFKKFPPGLREELEGKGLL